MRVEDLKSPPVVGEVYDVLCVKRSDHNIPILASAHTDEELSNPFLHFHLDVRFITDERIRWAFGDVKFDPMGGIGQFRLLTFDANQNETHFLAPMECVRAVPNFHSPRLERGTTYNLTLFNDPAIQGKLEDLFEDHKLSSCKRCPHHGTPLANQPTTNGKVTCPAHLLKWNLATGNLCRKTVKENGVYRQL